MGKEKRKRDLTIDQRRGLWLKIARCHGVLEYWSIGVLEKAKIQIYLKYVFIITPLLQHTAELKKDLCKPLGGSLRPTVLNSSLFALVLF